MTLQLVKKELILTLPLEKAVPSRSGKTLLIAGTHGTIATDVLYRGRQVVINANAFVYRKKRQFHGHTRAGMRRHQNLGTQSHRLTDDEKDSKKHATRGRGNKRWKENHVKRGRKL